MEPLKRLFYRLRHTWKARHNRPLQDARRDRPLQDARCDRPLQNAAKLLQMPIEIIIRISNHLPRHSLYTLAQSCYPLQTILRQHFHLEGSGAHTQPLDVFSCLSKDLLDRLVCDRCIAYSIDEYKEFPQGPWREYQLNTMALGCKRRKFCPSECCHPPHLCSCHRHDPMPYTQKQHIELVLKHTGPSRIDNPRLTHVIVPRQRAYAYFKCKLGRTAIRSPRSMTYHYTIMSRIVQDRFLLFCEIRWTNADTSRFDILDGRYGPSLLHHYLCPVVMSRGRLIESQYSWRDTIVFAGTEYGAVKKCCVCMAESITNGGRDNGIARLWQDLGSAKDPRHECCLGVDIVVDKERAQREAGNIVRLFGRI